MQADLRLCWSHIPHCLKSHVAAQMLLKMYVCGDSMVVDSLFVFAPTVCVWGEGSVFCNVVLNVLLSCAIIKLKKGKLVALLKLCSFCRVTVCVLYLFLAVP